LLAQVKPGDSIITVKLDRAFRDTIDGLKNIMAWSEQGINLHIADGDMVTDTSTSSGFLNVGIHLLMAHFERLRGAERTSDVLQSKKARGERVCRKDRLPYGIMLDPNDDKKTADCPEERSIIDDIIKYKSIGKNNQEIADRLNAQWTLNRGKQWTRQAINTIVKREGQPA